MGIINIISKSFFLVFGIVVYFIKDTIKFFCPSATTFIDLFFWVAYLLYLILKLVVNIPIPRIGRIRRNKRRRIKMEDEEKKRRRLVEEEERLRAEEERINMNNEISTELGISPIEY